VGSERVQAEFDSKQRALNDINLATAKTHEATAKKVLEQVTQALSMRTVTIAQIATSLICNAHPQFAGCTVQEAVKQAAAILAEAENPSPEPKESTAPGQAHIAGIKVPPIQRRPGQPVKIGWYDNDLPPHTRLS
jgi:hypothetical protein